MWMNPGIVLAEAALAAVRQAQAREIATAMRSDGVLGVLGEAEVGKTKTVAQACAQADDRPLYIDLTWAASDEHLGFMLAREIARAFASSTQLQALRSLRPLSSELTEARANLTEILGVGLEEALRSWPSGRFGWPAALEGLEALAEQREVLLWIDHIEAPGLSFRHPVKTAPLLWSLGELVQRAQGLRLLISGREAASADAVGPRAAFDGRGRWLQLSAPSIDEWLQVADRLGAPTQLAAELARLTDGHVRTMLLALTMSAGAGAQSTAASADELLLRLAAEQEGLASRAIEHARSLHRLGAQVLTQAALGQRPYATAQRGSTTTQDLSKALKRLRLAGLLRHEQRWTVANPLVAMVLRQARESPTSARRPWS